MNLFFLELIIVLLFFSVSGAVILKMFATAEIMSEKSEIGERAVMCVQSIAELHAAEGDMKTAVEELFGAGAATYNEGGFCTIYLDEDMKPLITAEGRIDYGKACIVLHETVENGVCGKLSELSAEVYMMCDNNKLLYSQTSSAYIPEYNGRERMVTDG